MTNNFTANFSKKLLVTAVAASFMLEAAPSMSQSGQLEEVLVTARKRVESILTVPVTASVFSGETLDEFAINDVKGIANLTPGLNFASGPLSSGVLVSMRGIGTGSNNPAVDQSIALVVDGMQFTQGLAFKSANMDMANVEVLKGPQALFFGKAAPGGVISITTKDPGSEPEVMLRGGYEFEAEEKLAELVLSGPVSDTLGLRLAARYSDKDGYFTNNAVPTPVEGPFTALLGDLGAGPVTDKHFPATETVLVRGTALWEPTDKLSARLKLNYESEDTSGAGGEPQLVDCPDGTQSVFAPLGVNFINQDNCKLDKKQNFVYFNPDVTPGVYNGGKQYGQLDQYYASLELNYDFDNDLTLSSVTGYYDVNHESLINPSLSTGVGGPFGIQGKLDRYDFTQELRLTSDYSGDWNFILGMFYQDGQTNFLSGLPANQAYNTFIGIIDPTGSRLLPPVLAWADHTVDAETLSAFGQVLWNITSDLELGLGARWTDEQRDHDAINRMGKFTGAPIVPFDLITDSISSDHWSPEVSLTWTPTDDITVYGNVKQAYKSGSFDVGGAPTPGVDSSFADEKITGGELGFKSRLLDSSLAINAAAYYYEYDDMQVEERVFDPRGGAVGVRTANAASSEIYGVDLDLSYIPGGIDGLTLFAALNWNSAEYKDFPNAACWPGQLWGEGCNVDLNGDGVGDAQDLSGGDLLRAPEWMGNIGFRYETSVFDGMGLRISANTSYSDSYSASSTNIPSGYQDSYTKSSAAIALIGGDERWVLELIGDNLEDELTYGGCAPQGYADTLLFGQEIAGTGTVAGGPGGKPENACFVEPGRSVWLRLTWNFF